MNVTGYCWPCKSIEDAAQVHHKIKHLPVIAKLGKQDGHWYVVGVVKK